MPRIVLNIPLFLLSLASMAQVQLTPVLVGSTGGFYSFSGGSISVSAGEAVITTAATNTIVLTQGFQQPRILTDSIQLSFNINTAECISAKNGALKVNISGGMPPYTYFYEIQNSNGDFVELDLFNIADTTDTIYGLAKGIYRVTVTDYYLNTVSDTLSIGVAYEGDCKIKIYSGFSPNGDGINDTWIIDGIEYYPDNAVFIYNRWGDLQWQATAYDNQEIVWNGYSQVTGELLVNGTYFYIVIIEDKQFKGWVELSR